MCEFSIRAFHFATFTLAAEGVLVRTKLAMKC